jgi:hypothetical protein
MTERRISGDLLAMSATRRVAVAAVLVAVLWLFVLWAY